MEQQEYFDGEWTDSNGSRNHVRFKKKWGEHIFSEDEKNRLLQGKAITFPYKRDMIRGHLQYKTTQEGVRYFGFCTDFDKEYTDAPRYEPMSGSRFARDSRNEILMNDFMRTYYYSKLKNSDGSKVDPDYISDESEQAQGIDVVFVRNRKKYVIDEKAQLDYICNEAGPLPTFALELLNSSSGKIGWFINDELKTEYYMFIWPYADDRLTSVGDIEYADYALVERPKLKQELESRYHLSMAELQEYAWKISKGELEGADEQDNNRVYYKNTPFDQSAYLVYTKAPGNSEQGKVERPVNLVVRKTWIENIAEETGTLRRQ